MKGGVGLKISRVEKFQKINNRGWDDYSEPASNCFNLGIELMKRYSRYKLFKE